MAPEIVCLCGSSRFKEEYLKAALSETMAGRIVLMIHAFAHADGIEYTPDEKATLDTLHLRKIDLADQILVIDVGGYIGYSTKREIAYAESQGKHIRRWSEESGGEDRGK